MNAQEFKEKKTETTGAHHAQRLGIAAGMTVQEVGWDEDCDSTISEAIEDIIGEELLDEETDEACDVVLLWWRSDDGDLVDGLVDSIRPLADNGRIWLLTPGAGKQGDLDPGEISESAQLAGLVQTKAERLGAWQGSCLVQRGNKQ
ncbi:DUF3052 domain-containing protein [Corynebacterium diphtheriae]|uniref:DUF3052 domain-containing protein n=1 Tax=Corynebacterium diphtheriae TaxID=1717 RepID=UPI000245A8E3|nr:DUF3052 domain-containing protein [Corynebacterium diphtheriae]AEX42362.1 hypothetical protein CD31A_1693 [Corynebacterium diphtheriae 31A]MBG9246061.1 DUF3052 domain-containing protein [Corynebacterium diphtheriae bv. mitis]MBG9247695.1 DUF3052 domain-containing protein [Corynebacterium diphtheriae bv. gravis]MBG9289493.1 DUF3052 domain-containing protein [Corynebacterium diphtheriae bv. gravis]MBG9296013.1 DUF3052 domain-containing protein [Corynebacterium diphtheriae bv. gravis]